MGKRYRKIIQAKQDIEIASRNAYQEGWNDAVKKIDNFIERHCKD